MKKYTGIILLCILTAVLFTDCKKKKESSMVDMDTIRTDGSHDDSYIFREEIEKEKNRKNRYKKNSFK